jgi:hypothetical protein
LASWRSVQMTNKRKQRARALSEKTGMSHQAAINALTASTRAPAVPPVERSLQQLLTELGVTSTFGVVTGRCQAVGASATLALAIEKARALARKPLYFAESTPLTLIVSALESRLLLDAGAAELGVLQVIRAFTRDGMVHTISEQCERCRRWIWCFKHPKEANVEDRCSCGHPYRIMFDAEVDWSRTLNARCMQCGTEHRMSQRHENLNPWRWINGRQILCNKCARAGESSA